MDLRRRLLPPLALAALSVAVAASFGRVFASSAYLWPLVGAAIAPHALGVLFRSGRLPRALLPLASVVVLGGYVVWGLLLHTTSSGLPGHATWHELGQRLDAGWAVLRNDQVPVPASAGAVLLAVIAVWVMAQIADVVAFDADATLGALAPAVTVFIWLCALGTSTGATGSTIAVGTTAAMYVAVQHQTGLERRRTMVGSSRATTAPSIFTVAAVSAVGALLIAAVIVPELPGAGASPLIDLRAIGRSGSNPSYRTSIAPLIDVGAKLNRSTPEELFTVRSKAADYWRITALDDYRDEGGGQWTLSAEGDGAISEGLDGGASPAAVTQEFTIGPLDERWMPAAYRPVSVSLDDTLVVRSSATLVTGRSSVSGLHYTVVSELPETGVPAAQQAATARPVPASLRRYTDLPPDFPTTIVSLAHRLTDGQPNPYAKAKVLRDYFRGGEFSYDTRVDLGDDESALVNFLFDQKRGFCVQFASAYATMARAIGIPARVAVGFTPGKLDSHTGVYRVSTEDAHAWPEIWLAGLGWTHLFDPTPPAPGHLNSAGGSDLPNEPKPSFGSNPQPTTNTTVPTTPSVTQRGVAQPAPATTPATAPPVVVKVPDHSGGAGVAVTIAVVVGAVLLALLAAVGTVLFAKSRRRATRRARPEPSAAVRGAWEEALDRLRDHGFSPPTGATAYEIAAQAPVVVGAGAAAPMRVLAGVHSAACYGGRPPDADAVDRAWREVEALDAALDGQLGPVQRARRRLDPATLREPRQADGWSTARSSATKD